MKKLLIISDMEGCIDVFNMSDYSVTQEKMITEIGILIESILSLNQFEVTVVDCHNTGSNVFSLKRRFPSVSFVSHLWNVEKIDTFDCAILTGFHARAGVIGWFPHTWRPEFSSVEVGNRVVGEIEMIANALAFFGIRVAAVAGDESARPEAVSMNVPFYATKTRISTGKTVDENYAGLCGFITSALSNPSQYSMSYNAQKVSIQFYNKMYLGCIPDGLFKKEKDRLVFTDTMEFFQSIYGLSMFLNASNMLQREMTERLKKLIRSQFTKDTLASVDNQEIKRILDKSSEHITFDDWTYLFGYFTKLDVSGRWSLMVGG